MPINPLQLPGQFQSPTLDFSPLAELGKTYQAAQVQGARQRTLAELGQGANADYGKAIGSLMSIGDIEGAGKIAAIQKAVSPESSAELQSYKYAQAQGYKGSLLDYTKEKAAAGATRINQNVNTGEKAYDTALGKEYADRFIASQKAGAAAPSAIANLDLMEKVSQDPNFYSGSGGEMVTRAKKLATSLGIADADSAAPNELFQKLASKTVLDSAGGSLGAGFSNADRDFLQGTVANINNTPEGNRQIIGISRAVQKRNQELAGLARDYVRKNGRMDVGFDAVAADFAEKNPLFKGQAAATRAPPSPTQAAPRRAPDGNYYIPDPQRPGKYLQVQP